MSRLYDCIVVGAGPAGLSASLFLARYLHPVLTFHHNSPRNEYAHGVHGFLGHHGIAPAELLARGRDEVSEHGGLIIEACVTSVRKISDDHFRITSGAENQEPRTFDARRLLLATGLRDLTPDCPGFREFYGVSVHHCPDCDGYESRDKRIAVLGNGKKTVGFALSLLTWTNKITLITGGDAGGIDADDHARLKPFNIEIRNQSITALEGDKDSKQLSRILLSDNDSIECDSLFFNLGTEPASDLHEMLGCKLDEECGLIWVDETQQTSVIGVYAAGDITPNSQLAIVAAAEGAMAAIHVHQSLVPAERKL
ncbi:MAG TPA: NAD(P)/FAD-dependent oxidoreductase [Pyrinomonadaceae bacterium]|jgi:thioredoxin reductase|nr:NAD(P)/FAD-dependent oxidoreductase [Pyrinomonadaceae bacterium]